MNKVPYIYDLRNLNLISVLSYIFLWFYKVKTNREARKLEMVQLYFAMYLM